MWKKILIFLGIISATTFVVITFLISSTVTQIKNGDYSKASKTAKVSLVIVEPISKITFQKNTNVELLKHSLYLVRDIPAYSKNLIASNSLGINNNYILDLLSLKYTLQDFNDQLQPINELINQSRTIKQIINNSKIADKNYLININQLSNNLPDFIKILDSFCQKDQKIVMVFQNSDELRATGGFMGSYAVLDIVDGKIIEIITEDIYDADGQFDGFVEAPSGVKEYLSDGKGLRLPNANWNPDFPTSAEQILQFLALGNKKNITTLVAINPDYAKIILAITGNITLKDYNTIVDSNNITEVLRSRRSTFFPGSNQKKHLLSQLLAQLQIKLSDLDEKSKINIIQQTSSQLLLNNIQIYSNINEIDQIFSKHGFRQELEYKENSDYLFLVESNVGINKANKSINRDVSIEIDDEQSLITVNFRNNNLSPLVSNLSSLIGDNEANESNENSHLGYVNYQRLIIKPDQNLEYIKYNNQIISQWDEGIIENSKGQEFKEIGFIITLKEQEDSVLEIKLKNLNENKNKVYVQKQPGLPATPYVIRKNGFISQFLIEKNTLAELQ